jgi:flagellar protein FliL
MATSAVAAKPVAEAPAAPPRKKSKLLLIVLAVFVLLAAGAAATWWFMQPADEDEEAEVEAKPSIFLPLEQFTVNLQPEEGQQFLQVAMTLNVSDPEIAEGIKAQMPQVRSRVLFLLSSKKPSELSSVEGKNRLSEQLIQEVEAVLPAVKSKGAKRKKAGDEDGDEGKSKKAKGKKAKAKDEAQAQEERAPRRVLAVYFTHFIVQ